MVQTYGNKATRRGFGEGLLLAGEANPDVVVVSLDLTTSTEAHLFKEKFPERFINLGIAEQNGIGVAAGLSLTGKIPYVCTFGVFASGRCWDQLRISLCYSDSNVKVAGSHCGISVGPDGATHQALEDIALMRVLPNMKVIVPCDYLETKRATVEIARVKGPVYLRFGRESMPIITTDSTPFVIGKANIIRNGKDVALIACGSMVFEALTAAELLEKKGISARVINLHTIKPIDEEALVDAAKSCGAVITCEEHQISGGMGSAVAEVLAVKCPVPVTMIGMHDEFGESGKAQELMSKFHLKDIDIAAAAENILKRKK